MERCSSQDGHPREDDGWRSRTRPAREFLVPLPSVYQKGKIRIHLSKCIITPVRAPLADNPFQIRRVASQTKPIQDGHSERDDSLFEMYCPLRKPCPGDR